MKKIIGFSSLAVLLMTMAYACGPAEVKKEKEVIIVPVQTKTVTEPAKKTTTISIDNKGVKVETKKDN